MNFELPSIGRWSPEITYDVTVQAVRKYAEAVGETSRVHLDGNLAPPTFAVVPPQVSGLLDQLRQNLLRLPPELRGRSVHGEQDLHQIEPIRPGMRLQLRGRPIRVQGKGESTIVTYEVETRESGRLMNVQYAFGFLRGVRGTDSYGTAAPTRPDSTRPDGLPAVSRRDADGAREWTVEQRLTPDQTHRYAEASGDLNPIHVDREAARRAGFDEVIVHGLCTMAFATRAVCQTASKLTPSPLRRVAVRFTKPAFPGQRLLTRIWRLEPPEAGNDLWLGFETCNNHNQAVIRHGFAVFGPAGPALASPTHELGG